MHAGLPFLFSREALLAREKSRCIVITEDAFVRSNRSLVEATIPLANRRHFDREHSLSQGRAYARTGTRLVSSGFRSFVEATIPPKALNVAGNI